MAKTFDAIIILNSPSVDVNIIIKLADVPIIAADGAANNLLNYTNILERTTIIGDLDSVNKELLANHKINHIYIENQNTYDFEKAIEYAIQQGFQHCLVMGIEGGLIEHSINNWSILIKYSNNINLYPYSDGRIGFYFNRDITFNVHTGKIVSILPTNTLKLTTAGLKWAANVLELGKYEGARNLTIGNEITFREVQGSGFVFVDDNLPFTPDFTYL